MEENSNISTDPLINREEPVLHQEITKTESGETLEKTNHVNENRAVVDNNDQCKIEKSKEEIEINTPIENLIKIVQDELELTEKMVDEITEKLKINFIKNAKQVKGLNKKDFQDLDIPIGIAISLLQLVAHLPVSEISFSNIYKITNSKNEEKISKEIKFPKKEKIIKFEAEGLLKIEKDEIKQTTPLPSPRFTSIAEKKASGTFCSPLDHVKKTWNHLHDTNQFESFSEFIFDNLKISVEAKQLQIWFPEGPSSLQANIQKMMEFILAQLSSGRPEDIAQSVQDVATKHSNLSIKREHFTDRKSV